MRCPLCNARVRDKDTLQIHYVESCNAIGCEDMNRSDRKFDEKGTMEDEPTSDLVEVVFNWDDTKDSTEKSICLISSLAGQIKLHRDPAKSAFESARVIVPCGVHSCQLVVDEECYPVVDINIDLSSEIVYIILQEGTKSCDEPIGTTDLNYGNRSYLQQEEECPSIGGAMQQDEINLLYARKILKELEECSIETDPEEIASLKSHDSNCEAVKMTRRKKQLEDLSSGQSRENLAKLAKNGIHQAQVHTTVDDLIAKEDASFTVMDRAIEPNRKESKGSVNGDRKGSKGSLVGSITEEREESSSSLFNKIGEGSNEHFLEPPNGFQSGTDQRQKMETKRLKTLSKIAKSKRYYESLSNQGLERRNSGDSLKKKNEAPTQAGVPTEEKPSWGFDEDENIEEGKVLETTTSEEVISELISKCDSYKEKFEKLKLENLQLESENEKLNKKSMDEYEVSLTKDEKIEEYKAKCESFETELERMNNENEDLLRKIVSQEEQISKKCEELETLEMRLESILRDNKELKEENESLQTANKLQREDMDRIIQDEVEALKDKLNSVKVGSRSFQYEEMKKMNGLERQVSRLNSENERLKRQLSRIKTEANLTEHDDDHVDGVEYPRDSYLTSNTASDGFGTMTSRKLLPTEDSYKYSSKSDDVYRASKRTSRVKSDTTHGSYDAYDDPYSFANSKPRDRPSSYYDTNQNHLHDSETVQLKTRSRHSDVMNSRASTTGPIRASHFDYIATRDNELSKYGHGGDVQSQMDHEGDHVMMRGSHSRRERPRSFHGVTASENDSRELRRNLPPYQHEDSSQYTYTLRSHFNDSLSSDYLKKHVKPFAPDSMDDITVGMRVLVTRSSGRTGKGIVQWKGYLDGHHDQFIGIELETPNGKHDGMYEGRRYFRCKKDHGIFSKFSKVVMVWGSL